MSPDLYLILISDQSIPSCVYKGSPVFFLHCLVQTVLRESRELHGDMESMAEKVELLSEVLQVESMSQQVCELSRHTEELQQSIKLRLQSLEDADKVCVCNIY